MKKRVLALLGACLLAVSAVTGCASGAGTGTAGQTVSGNPGAQTAEGALDEVTNMLQRMRTLAVQSANGTNSSVERKALNDEVIQLRTEIKRIGSDTSFGGKLKIFGASGNTDSLANLTGGVKFQVGSHANQTIDVTFKSMSTLLGDVNLTTMTGVNLSTASQSQAAITNLDTMIGKVDDYRATLGATQNRLESTISNQENVIENVSDARSRIKDVDYASETAKMAQQQILQQASTAMLSQANQKNSIALNLLG